MIGNILIREPITPEEFTALISEFPQYRILNLPTNESIISLGLERCQQVEVMYGSNLEPSELHHLPHLHWIHSPSPYLDMICLDEIKKQANILVTTTKNENVFQMGEFAMSAAMAYAKEIFSWEEGSLDPKSIDIMKIRERMWRIQDCRFLQVGLGLVGTEIARRAKDEGFQVWGGKEISSFHPHCETVFAMDEINKILPKVDILSLALPRERPCDTWLTRERLDLMKDDSVILGFGAGSVFDLDALSEVGMTGKFRGILLDAHFSPPIKADYPLWAQPRVIVTHESGPYPLSEKNIGFSTFLQNLRQYVFGNFSDMKNLL